MQLKKKRLDLLLVEQGLSESRNKAQALIMAGQVVVHQFRNQSLEFKDKKTTQRDISVSKLNTLNSQLLKPGTLIFENSKIEIKSPCKYVSRGGEKLESALRHWNIDVKEKISLDVGASTGGFSDCLLQNGAKKIYAVDVGHGQIHPKVRNDPRVEVFEKSHILKWEPPWGKITDYRLQIADLNPKSKIQNLKSSIPSFVTIDVSFISLEKVLPRVVKILNLPPSHPEQSVPPFNKSMGRDCPRWDEGSPLSTTVKGKMLHCVQHDRKDKLELLVLIKPQFEVGQKFLRKGVVKDQQARQNSIEKILKIAEDLGCTDIKHFPCPVLGPKGNQEEWMYCKNKKDNEEMRKK